MNYLCPIGFAKNDTTTLRNPPAFCGRRNAINTTKKKIKNNKRFYNFPRNFHKNHRFIASKKRVVGKLVIIECVVTLKSFIRNGVSHFLALGLTNWRKCQHFHFYLKLSLNLYLRFSKF